MAQLICRILTSSSSSGSLLVMFMHIKAKNDRKIPSFQIRRLPTVSQFDTTNRDQTHAPLKIPVETSCINWRLEISHGYDHAKFRVKDFYCGMLMYMYLVTNRYGWLVSDAVIRTRNFPYSSFFFLLFFFRCCIVAVMKRVASHLIIYLIE